jgi:hypothetical protein
LLSFTGHLVADERVCQVLFNLPDVGAMLIEQLFVPMLQEQTVTWLAFDLSWFSGEPAPFMSFVGHIQKLFREAVSPVRDSRWGFTHSVAARCVPSLF